MVCWKFGIKAYQKLIELKIFKPNNKHELEQIISQEIAKKGNCCDLNHIDTSLITDMSDLFFRSSFKGDISKWDTSAVLTMMEMFTGSLFNGDISQWNTSNVLSMRSMFSLSDFTGDLSNWNTSNVIEMNDMFSDSQFNGDISKWDVGNVEDMRHMFSTSGFNKSVDVWSPYSLVSISSMFDNCAAVKPAWNIENKEQRDLYLRSRAEKSLVNTSLSTHYSLNYGICKTFKL